MANIKYLYVAVSDDADANNRVVKLRADNLAWTRQSNIAFNEAVDVTCDASRVYVVDSFNRRVVSLNLTDLAYVAEVQFDNPRCVVAYGGYLYVGGQINKPTDEYPSGEAVACINKYSLPDLTFIAQIDTPIDPALPGWSGFSPYKMCTDGTYLYIADTQFMRLGKLLLSDFSLVSLYKYAPLGWPNPLTDGGYNTADWLIPGAVATDGTYLYVSDVFYYNIEGADHNHIVKLLCSDLSYVSHVGYYRGTGNDQFYYPRSIAYDGGYIYIADTNNRRIQKRNSNDLSFVSMGDIYGPVNHAYYSYPWGVAVAESAEENISVSKTWTTDWDVGSYISKEYNYLWSNLIADTGGGIDVGAPGIVLSAFLYEKRKMKLNWTFGSNADFQVFWKSSIPAGQEMVLLGSTNAFSFTTPDLESSKTYTFYVRANVGVTFVYSNVVELFVSCGKGVVLSVEPPSPPPAQDPIYFYEASRSNNVIRKLNKSDLSIIESYGSLGSGNNNFNLPNGITSDGTYFYIVDTNNHRIVKRLVSDYSYISQIGAQAVGVPPGNDEFYGDWRIGGICNDGTYMYVVDSSYPRIMKRLLSNLSYVSQVGAWGYGANADFYYPTDITYANGKIYVTDTYHHRIRIYNSATLAYIGQLTGYLTYGYLYVASICNDGEYLYIVNQYYGHIVKVRISDLSYITHAAHTAGSSSTNSSIYLSGNFAGICVDKKYLYLAGGVNMYKIDKNTLVDLVFMGNVAGGGGTVVLG